MIQLTKRNIVGIAALTVGLGIFGILMFPPISGDWQLPTHGQGVVFLRFMDGKVCCYSDGKTSDATTQQCESEDLGTYRHRRWNSFELCSKRINGTPETRILHVGILWMYEDMNNGERTWLCRRMFSPSANARIVAESDPTEKPAQPKPDGNEKPAP